MSATRTAPRRTARGARRLAVAAAGLGLSAALALGLSAPATAQPQAPAPITASATSATLPALVGGDRGWRGPRVTDEIVTQTQARGRVLSLTFDDGPDPEDTPALLDVLRRHRVKAVFCLWGDHVRQHPDLVRRIAREGHTLCNHSMTHANLSTQTPEQIRTDLLATNALIRSVVPRARIPYFRAPYGAWGASPQVAAELGMQPLGWTFAVEDWEEPGSGVLVDRVRTRLVPRSVVLLHDGGGDRSGTVQAVERIIPELRAQGWRFVLPARRG